MSLDGRGVVTTRRGRSVTFAVATMAMWVLVFAAT